MKSMILLVLLFRRECKSMEDYTAAVFPAAESVKTREKSGLGRLATSMFKIGLIGFGGGSALIPVIEEEVVTEQGLVKDEDYEQAVISACVTPGALPIEIAAGVGRRTYGIRGMLAAAFAIALPGAFLTVLLLSAFSGSRNSSFEIIRYLSVGLGGFICSLLAGYSFKTASDFSAFGRRKFFSALAIMGAVFFLTGLKPLLSLLGLEGNAEHLIKLSTFQVLMLSFIVMFTVYVAKTFLRRGGKQNPSSASQRIIKTVSRQEYASILKESLVWIAFAAVCSLPFLFLCRDGIHYILKGLVSSLMSFGGGDAYLSVADGLFVESGMISQDAFYGILVPIANVLPGSILCKILTGTGYLVGIGATGSAVIGAAGAAAGFAVSIAASGMIFGIVYWIFRTFRKVSFFREISVWIRPIISGLLLGVTVTMLKTNVSTAGALRKGELPALLLTAGIAAGDLILMNRKKMNSVTAMSLSAVTGSLALLLL
ncbi:MAG TPA: hypothetical protein DCZ61_03445 [Lachnospiraceae bacterium]|nr:hypothetical protein [Lachnospiraceae bacterium]